MIQKLQKFFHTDKWWGKGIFIIVTYSIFWLVFYGALFFIPEDFFESYNVSSFVTLLYSLLIVPLLSLYLLKFFQIFSPIKKNILYIIHSFFILISFFVFFSLVIFGAIQNYSGF
jgi:hypothetical protein